MYQCTLQRTEKMTTTLAFEGFVEQANREISAFFARPEIPIHIKQGDQQQITNCPIPVQDQEEEKERTLGEYEYENEKHVITVYGDPDYELIRHEVVHAYHTEYNLTAKNTTNRVNLTGINAVAHMTELTENERERIITDHIYPSLLRLISKEVLAHSYDRYKPRAVINEDDVIEKGFHGRVYIIQKKSRNPLSTKEKIMELEKTIQIFTFPPEKIDTDTLKDMEKLRTVINRLYEFAYGHGQSFGMRLYTDTQKLRQPSFRMIESDSEFRILAGLQYETVSEATAQERLQTYLTMDIQDLATLVTNTINTEKKYILGLARQHLGIV